MSEHALHFVIRHGVWGWQEDPPPQYGLGLLAFWLLFFSCQLNHVLFFFTVMMIIPPIMVIILPKKISVGKKNVCGVVWYNDSGFARCSW